MENGLLQKSVLLHCCWTATQKYSHLSARNKVIPHSCKVQATDMRETLLSLDGFAFYGPSSEGTTADSVTQATSTLVKDVGYLDSVNPQTVWRATRHGRKATAQDGWSMICLHPHT